ncbi:MAG: enoyl-CoA hydratase/isomerase family protein [Burkholderiaceae bacterium]
MSTDKDVLRTRQADGVFEITLNRPEALNAFNEALKEALFELPHRIQSDDEIRAVIITGAGRAFCAGADVNWFVSGPKDKRFRYEYRRIHDFFDQLERMEKPVIAAINGTCAGGGLEMALACDIRLAAEGASFLYPEHRIGLIPASGGCSRMINAVGASWTKYIVLSGERLDSAAAHRLGLVHEVLAPEQLLERAWTLARHMAGQATMALGIAKHVINVNTGIDQHTARFVERLGQAVLVKTQDHQEGVTAFLEKRKAQFSGR